MKIALTCPASLPATQFGGILFLTLDIAKEASKNGHEVTIYTTDLDFANNPKTFNKNLPRIEKIENFTINRSHVWFSFSLFYVTPNMYFKMIKTDADIIHSIGIRSFQSFVAAIVSKKKNIPLVISDQGGLTTHPSLQTSNIFKKILFKLQNPMISFIIKQATKISVPNDYEKQIFLQFCDKSKIETIRNGINLEIINYEDTNFLEKNMIQNEFILFLGRFNKIKGVDVLLNAIHLIKDDLEISKIKLVIMGVDFGFESQMLNLIKKLKIQNNVIVIKNPSRGDVITAYRNCKFLVLPSRWELSPLTPLEGFAFKKTVISSKIHGIPFTITDKENCVLVESENYHDLSKAILELLKDEKKCAKYGLSGYNMVQEICNSKVMATDTLSLYQKIINR